MSFVVQQAPQINANQPFSAFFLFKSCHDIFTACICPVECGRAKAVRKAPSHAIGCYRFFVSWFRSIFTIDHYSNCYSKSGVVHWHWSWLKLSGPQVWHVAVEARIWAEATGWALWAEAKASCQTMKFGFVTTNETYFLMLLEAVWSIHCVTVHIFHVSCRNFLRQFKWTKSELKTAEACSTRSPAIWLWSCMTWLTWLTWHQANYIVHKVAKFARHLSFRTFATGNS